MVRLIGNLLYWLGRTVGYIKGWLGIPVKIPEKYRR